MRVRALVPLVAIAATVLAAVFVVPAAQAVEKAKEKVYAEPNEEKAIVYLIRTKRLVSAVVPIPLYADDELLGVLANNCYTYAYVDPGERILSTGSLNAWSDWEYMGANKRFEFEPGETYYFSVWSQIDHLSRVSGKRLIQEVKYYCSPSDEEIQTAKSKVFDRTGKTEDLDELDRWVIPDWSAHHEAHIAKWPRVELSGYSILVIEDFKVTDPKTAKREWTDVMLSAPNRVANFVQSFLAPGTFREVRREEFEQPDEAALILRVELTQYKPGSKATRGLVGLGTGASRLDFNARLIDGGNGSVLATFSDERAYAWGGTRGARGGIDVIEKNLAYELATYLERQSEDSVAAQPEESAPAPVIGTEIGVAEEGTSDVQEVAASSSTTVPSLAEPLAHAQAPAEGSANLEPQHILCCHFKPVRCVAFSPDGRWLASASFDRYIKLWDVATGKEMHTLRGHRQWVLSVAFSPDGRWLASGSRDTTVKLWDVATGKSLRTLAGHTDQVHEVTFSPDGRWLASGSWDKTVKLWDAATWEERRTLAGHSVAFSPDGRSLALLSDDGSRLLDVATWEERRTLAGRFVMAFSPDGRSLAVVSPSASEASAVDGIELWDLASWEAQRTLAGRLLGGVSVQSVAFSPDGRALAASGNLNTTVTVWEVATGKQLSTLTGMGIGFSVAFSPDGRWLAAPGYGTKKGSHPLAPLEDWEIALWKSDDARALLRVAQDPLVSKESDVTPPPVAPAPLIPEESPAPLIPREAEVAPFTNADVLKMVAAGIGDEIIIQAIRSRSHSFDVSTDAIVELKTAGVSDNVIVVMLGGSVPEPSVEPTTTLVTIKDGTDLVLQLDDPLSSATSQVDDPVRLVVAEDIIVDGKVAVQVGAPARGKVTLASSRKSFGRRGKLDFTIDWVQAANGDRLRLRYTKAVRGDEKYGKAGVIGALFGPFAFFVKGKEVEIHAGTEYTLYIDGEHEIEVTSFSNE